jgi:hypothetical protein
MRGIQIERRDLRMDLLRDPRQEIDHLLAVERLTTPLQHDAVVGAHLEGGISETRDVEALDLARIRLELLRVDPRSRCID